jgi:type IV pilus assembly protein PilB
VQVPTDEQVLLDVGYPPNEIPDVVAFRGTGCKVCNDTGYKGRIALYEVMPFSDRLREIVLQGGSTAELKDEMIREGVSTLRMAGLQKVLKGVTTIDEIVRVTAADS